MADFQSQVMGLTGLTIDASSTAPSRSEFSTFLNDGVIDVTSKVVKLRPQDRNDFSRVSAEQTANASLDLSGADIISVIREDGVTSDNWRPCRVISPSLQHIVTDVDSLHFSSKFYPAYMVGDNGLISVFPAPGSNPNSFKVYYINNSPEETDGTALDHASTGIKWFPNDKVYLVVIYAAIKSLESAMSAKSIPTVSGDGTAPIELTDVSILDDDNTIDVRLDQGEIDQWWSTTGHFIEDEEDTELAIAQIQKITAYVQAYQAQLAGNTTDYGWMQARHQILSQQYTQTFVMMAPTPPSQPQQRAARR